MSHFDGHDLDILLIIRIEVQSGVMVASLEFERVTSHPCVGNGVIVVVVEAAG
jgi:hypothetical protein